MSLHFGICWIEDQKNEAEVDRVRAAVRNNGFEPWFTHVDEPAEIEAFAKRQDHHQEFDLILLDLNLGKGLVGDQLAGQVRASFRSTPILFYSALDETELRKRMAAQQVEGVYCVHRDRLAPRIDELVAHMSPALNRLSTMRGLAARVVAECDQDFRAILAHLGKVGDAAELLDSLKSKAKVAGEKHMESIEALDTLDGALASHTIQSAQLFLEAKDRARQQDNDELRSITRKLRENYQNQVIGRRNTLAHALEIQTADGSWEITRSGRDPITVGDFARFRADFIDQLTLVHRMRHLIIGEQPNQGLA